MSLEQSDLISRQFDLYQTSAIIGILEKIDSFYWPKMHLWKGDKKFEQGPPPPLIWKKSKRTAVLFAQETIPKEYDLDQLRHNLHRLKSFRRFLLKQAKIFLHILTLQREPLSSSAACSSKRSPQDLQ